MGFNLGTVFYSVDADTAALIEASRRADTQLGKLGTSFDKVQIKADGATKSIGLLKNVMAGYLSISFGKTLIDMADSYQVMSDRVMLAVNSTEEYNVVQQRLLTISNQLYRPLAESQELFIGTSDNLRDLGYTLNESLDIVDSLSGSFVRNATSAQKADSALKAYDRALNTGKVSAMEWQSLMSAIPNLAKDIGDSMGKSAEEVRNLGVQGQIATDMVNEGLLKSRRENVKLASEMKTTVADAYISMKDNISVYIGEQNKALGVTSLLATAIDGLGKNIEVIAKGAMALGVGALGKLTLTTGANTLALAKNSLANIKNQLDTRKAAVAAFNNAKANLEVAKAAALAAQRNLELGRSHGAAAAAALAHSKAIIRVAETQKLARATTFGLTSLLGGPAGIIGLLAAGTAAFALFSDKARETKEVLEELKQPLEVLVEKYTQLNAEQKAAAQIDFRNARKQAIEDEAEAYDDLISVLVKVNAERYKNDPSQYIGDFFVRQYTEQLKDSIANGGDFIDVVYEIAEAMNFSTSETERFIKAAKEFSTSRQLVSLVTDNINTLTGATKEAVTATNQLSAAQLALNKEASGSITALTANIQKQIETMEDNGNAVKQVDREFARLIETTADLDYSEIFEAYKAAYFLESLKKNNEELKKTGKTANRGAEAIADLQKQLYLATLSGRDLAVEQARLNATDYATQEQIDKITELAGALYEAQEIASRKSKFGDNAIDADKYILGDTSPLSGGMFDDQYARYEAEAQAEQERYALQLERLKEAKELQIETAKDYYSLEEQAAKEHADRMAQIEQAKAQVVLSTYSSAFGSIADVLKNAQGEQSSAYKVMFAASRAFALAEAGLNIGKAVSQAMADPSAMTTTEKLANYGLIAAEGAKIMSQIGGIAYGGGRQYGGPVAANKMYRVNETGEPEVFNAVNGQQYLLAGSNGNVTPMGKGGSGTLNFSPSITINVEAGDGMDQEELAQNLSDMIDGKLKKFAKDSQRPGGAFYRR